jgi:hypothetical protein
MNRASVAFRETFLPGAASNRGDAVSKNEISCDASRADQ